MIVLLLKLLSSILTFVVVSTTLFVTWRKLHTEHVDAIDQVFDRIFISAIIAFLSGRLMYVITHVSSVQMIVPTMFTFSSVFVGSVSLGVGISIFGFLLGDTWKDRFELLDYISIPLALLFSLEGWMKFIFLLLQQLVAVPSTRFVVDAILLCIQGVVFTALTWWLSRLELTYRTFLWYRYRRSSAQSGFVIAVFLIVYGIWGACTGWFFAPTLSMFGIYIEPIVQMIIAVTGFCMIYIRSGRIHLPKLRN